MKLLSLAISVAVLASFGAQAAPSNSTKLRDSWPKCTTLNPTPDVCDDAKCLAENDCVCFKSDINVPLKKRPQIVYLTFDDAITKLIADEYFSHLFDGAIKNPNNCTIRATHFLTHRSTDYTLVNKYYNMGHEIGVHSITHRTKPEYWKEMDIDGWEKEMYDMRKIIVSFANIPADKITGLRIPFLQNGGDEYFAAIQKMGFKYDCSWPSRAYGQMSLHNGVWPFTLDYEHDLDCQIEPCPSCSFPGVWVQPMLDLNDGRDQPCAMLDSCIPKTETTEDVLDMLMKNFERAYNGKTRAPLGLYVHAAWFIGRKHHFEAYMQFVKEIRKHEDVWIVPVSAGIEYRKNPKTNEQLINGELEAFNCDPDAVVEETCDPSINCHWLVENEDIFGEDVYMNICKAKCPKNYPWLGNPTGK